MRRERGRALLPALVLLAAGGVLAACGGGELPGFEREERALFPELDAGASQASAVRIAGGEDPFTLRRAERGWVLENKGGYPADGERVQAFLEELAGLTSIYVSTDSSPPYAEYGLAELEHPTSGAVRVRVEDRSGETLARLDVGHTFSTPGGSQLESVFVRRLGEDRVYLVDSDFQIQPDPMSWVDTDLVDVPRERVYRVSLSSRQGRDLSVRRGRDGSLTLAGSETLIESESTLGPLVGALESLSFRDVQAAAALQRADQPDYRASFRTFAGLRVSLRVHERDDDVWALLDVGVAEPAPEPEGAQGGETGKAAADAPSRAGVADVEERAEALAAATEGWAYRLPAHFGETLRRAVRAVSEAASPGAEAVGEELDSEPPSPEIRSGEGEP